MPLNEDGFTLVEVIVAFAIVAIGLGALYEAYSLSLDSLRRREEMQIAVMLAKSKLAEIGRIDPLEPGAMQGVFPRDKYRWRVEVKPSSVTAINPDTALALPYDVTVMVEWRNKGQPKTVSLATLRLEPRLR